MNLEAIGIAALCVSQAAMWWRNATGMRRAIKETQAHYAAVEAAAKEHTNGVREALALLETTERELPRYINAAAGSIEAKLEALRQDMPRRRNRRRSNPDAPIDLIPTTIAPLERDKRVTPSSDPVGKASS